MRTALVSAAALAAAFVPFSLFAQEPRAAGRPGAGGLVLAGAPCVEECAFPLEHTEADIEVSGFVSLVKVKQRFTNPYKSKIEAVYVFPLPDNAAVDDMTMRVGARTIRGLIKKREEARRIYDEARRSGHAAALLDQERPNIFTQSVANIMPGEKIEIEIRYVAPLKYAAGDYELAFPTVVGPRYIPGSVKDAARIAPPVMNPETTRSGHDIEIRVRLDAGVAVRDVRSPSHDISVERASASRAAVLLQPQDRIPNKDFVLRWSIAGEKPSAAVIAHRGERGGFFSLLIAPQTKPREDEIAARELVFVVDTSGSMTGAPIESCKEAMREALKRMRRDDSFLVMTFDDDVSALAPEPLENTAANVKAGLRFVDAMEADGGTQMIRGIRAALGLPRDPRRMRMVFFMTDGYIGNENEILAEVKRLVPEADARIFPLGVGSSVNRYLIERMAKEGRGEAQYVRYDEATGPAVARFYQRVQSPLLTDIALDWGSLGVEDVQPTRVPDLFAGQPVIVTGRFARGGRGFVRLRGRVAGRAYELPVEVELPASEPANEALASMWARARIESLTEQMYGGARPELVKEVTDTALKYRLVSQYTSFVAVEEREVRGPAGEPKRVEVPVELPDGVEYEGVFGAQDESGVITGALGGAMGRKAKGSMGYGAGGAGMAMGSASYARSGGSASIAMPMVFMKSPEPVAPAAPAPDRTVLSRHSIIEFNDNTVEGELAKPEGSYVLDRSAAKSSGLVGLRQAFAADAAAPAESAVSLEDLHHVFRRRAPELRKIFEEILKSDPNVRGRIVLDVTIAADGTVAEVKVKENRTGSEELAKRIVEKVKTWKFPVPSGGKSAITFPLDFAPGK